MYLNLSNSVECLPFEECTVRENKNTFTDVRNYVCNKTYYYIQAVTYFPALTHFFLIQQPAATFSLVQIDYEAEVTNICITLVYSMTVSIPVVFVHFSWTPLML